MKLSVLLRIKFYSIALQILSDGIYDFSRAQSWAISSPRSWFLIIHLYVKPAPPPPPLPPFKAVEGNPSTALPPLTAYELGRDIKLTL